MLYPIQFEYVDCGIVKFVQILEQFKFHFSDEILYRISIQWVGPATGSPMYQYAVVTKEEIDEMLKTRVDM